MRFTQKVTLASLVGLLVAAGAGLYLTSGSSSPSGPRPAGAAPAAETPSIDKHYVETARRLASQAATLEEQQAAKRALDAADHEADLEYAYALQVSSTQPVPQTPQILAIQNRISQLKKSVESRQAEVDQLKSLVQRVKGGRQDTLEGQLDVDQAELSFFQEALADAQDDLVQAGGDPHSRLEKLTAEHEAASNLADTFKFPPLQGPAPAGNLFAKWSRWKAIRQRQGQIEEAQQEVFAAAADLARQQDTLEKKVADEQARRKTFRSHELTPEQIAALLASRRSRRAPERKKAAPPPAAAATQASQAQAAANPPPPANPAILLIRRLSADQIKLRILRRQIQAMNSLGSAYAGWDLLVGASARSALHSIIADVLWVVLMMVAAFILNRLIDHFFDRLSLERKQKTTLEAVFRMSVRLIVVLVVLLLIFGKPDQLSTVLGLAGAGLTVVLKDFIVSFLGWFVLMGRHGIRVGDWVEINGVRGEVIEITLLRTVLLETGNWTDIGQPTGRQVSFLNQYAVDGYYFNFTTTGQWLWDELQVLIPTSQNPYPLIEKIQAIVAKETENNTQQAEREWQRVSHRYGVRPLSAQPSVNVKPTDNGVIAIVRYMTRADERTATRYRLNHEIVKLFRNGEELVSGAASLAETPASEPH
jgi:small-conductance mechanosensitive channel